MAIGKIISGAALATVLLAGGAGIALAQTSTTSGTGTTGTTGTTPGVPNTGAGGDAMANILLLGTSALIALGGGAYLSRRKVGQH